MSLRHLRRQTRIRGIISPAALTGTVNNYNPTDLAISTIVRIDPGGASRDVTGLQAGVDGEMKLLLNIADGAEDLVLKNQDAGSTAANRFYGANNTDVTVRRGGGTWVVYDATDSRWKPVAI